MKPARYGLLIWLIWIPIGSLEVAQSVYLMTCLCILSAYVLFVNFPSLTRYLHKKPTYYEDLENNYEVDELLRTRWQTMFVRLMNAVLSIVVGGLMHYGLYRAHHSTLSWFEVLGIVGGIWSLYCSTQTYIGQVLLRVLMFRKRREDELHHFTRMRRKATQTPRGEIEITLSP